MVTLALVDTFLLFVSEFSFKPIFNYYNGAIPGFFFLMFGFSIQLIENKIANDWTRTKKLSCRKQSLFSLSQNRCPKTV